MKKRKQEELNNTKEKRTDTRKTPTNSNPNRQLNQIGTCVKETLQYKTTNKTNKQKTTQHGEKSSFRRNENKQSTVEEEQLNTLLQTAENIIQANRLSKST